MKKGFTLIELLIVVAIIAILAAIAVPNFLEAQVRAKVSRCKADMRVQATAMESYFVDYNMYVRDSDSSLDAADWIEAQGVAYTPGDPIPSLTPSHADYHKYSNGAMQLTTPIAYMSELMDDPFANSVAVEGAGARGYRIASGSWSYATSEPVVAGTEVADPDNVINPEDHQWAHLVFKLVGPKPCYAIIGVGPDGSRSRMAYKAWPFMSNYEHAKGDGAEKGIPNGVHKNQPLQWVEFDSTNGSVSVGDIYRFGGSYRSAGRFVLNGEVIGNQDPAAGFTSFTAESQTIIW